ncbi:hypothetical protein MRY87_08290 [bacterium]|nr:hypothetical protein [bacterium]
MEVIGETPPDVSQSQNLHRIQWRPFAYDWFGEPTDTPPAYALYWTDEGLYFLSVTSFGNTAASLVEETPRFQAGLWKEEVSELFLLRSDGSYLEFHFSAPNLWWGASFSSYRIQEEEWADLQVATKCRTANGQIFGQLFLPTSTLRAVGLSRDLPLRAQVCCIGGGRYFSSGVPEGGFREPPDFHREMLFYEISFHATVAG